MSLPKYRQKRVDSPELIYAIITRDEDALSSLLSSGISPDARHLDSEIELGIYNYRAILYAASYGWATGVKILLNYGVNVHSRNSNGNNALIFACGEPTEERERVIELLIGAGIEFDVPTKSSNYVLQRGQTALMIAARNGNLYAIQRLLELGAVVNRPDADGCNALYYAASNDKLDAMVLLIRNGAEINIVPSGGSGTSLQELVAHGNIDGVNILLRHGADLNLRSEFNETVMHTLCDQLATNPWFLPNNVIITNNPKSDLFKWRYQMFDLFIDHDAEIDPVNCNGKTPMMMALENVYEHLVKMLIENGADVTLCTEEQRAEIQKILTR